MPHFKTSRYNILYMMLCVVICSHYERTRKGGLLLHSTLSLLSQQLLPSVTLLEDMSKVLAIAANSCQLYSSYSVLKIMKERRREIYSMLDATFAADKISSQVWKCCNVTSLPILQVLLQHIHYFCPRSFELDIFELILINLAFLHFWRKFKITE